MSLTNTTNATFTLSQTYNDHPIVWLNPMLYNAENQNYTSIEDAKRAYNKEKRQIISCYERQLQRILSQFSIALKQIEYLEEFRKEQNKHNRMQNQSIHSSPMARTPSINSVHNSVHNSHRYSNSTVRSLIEIQYDSIIDKLNRKIRFMNDEMVDIKNLYIKKIDIISKQQTFEINGLKTEINEINNINHEMKRDSDNINQQLTQQLSELNELNEQNIYLEKQLRAAAIKHKLFIKKQRDEVFLKAKKKIQLKKQKEMAEEEFKLQLEQMQINKDIVINRLAQEYHQIANKEQKNKDELDKLYNKLTDITTTHENEIAQLKDEYVSRIHYHRKQIQDYVNNKSISNISTNEYNQHNQYNQYNQYNNDNEYKSDDTSSSQSHSQSSADEIVTSLVIGIDEKLDDLLTPIHHNYNNNYSTHYNDLPSVNINIHHNNNIVNIYDNELTPEPMVTDIRNINHVKRSNASLLFAKPLIQLINSNDNDINFEKYNDLLQQNCEYEDTMKRYEKQIDELQESINEMLSKNELQETEIINLREKHRKSKRREFDWVTKEQEYKSLLSQYREVRETNATLTLTYFTLQCEYDKLKRDYDKQSAMVMNYGDYQINLTNQINYLQNTSNNSLYSNDDDNDDNQHISNNISYFDNNIAFQYSAKTKDELIDDIVKLREKLSEMTDTKFSILQSTKQEIHRLEQEIERLTIENIDSNINTNTNIDNIDNIHNMDHHHHHHTNNDNESDKDNDTNTNKQHQRAQSMANSKYLLPINNHNKNHIIIDENHSDNDI